MKINKTLQNFADVSLEKYNNNDFLTELLEKIEPPIIENNKFKLNKLALSTLSVVLMLALSIPIIVQSTRANNPPIPTISNSTSEEKVGGYIEQFGEMNEYFIRYRFETNVFDINEDVKATISYGLMEVDYLLKRNGLPYNPYHYIIIQEQDVKEIQYKYVEEELLSKKYEVFITYNEDYEIVNIEYNHSEEVVIPKELFSKESGRIVFAIKGNDPYDGSSQDVWLCYIGFTYSIKDGKIILKK